MGRNRSRSMSRSRSYSPRRSRSRSPPRRKPRYDDFRERERFRGFRDRRSLAPTGLLVRNISLDARPEDLRIPFERFGPVKDVYLPRNYYTGEPRGFGFVKYRNPDDAAEAKYHMNHQIIGGREITIVFAEENRKNPQEMRANARIARSSRYDEGGFRRRSPPPSPRHRRHSYTRSPSPPRHGSRVRRAHEDYSDERSFSQSPIPRSVSRSPRAADMRSLRRASSPKENGRSPIRRQMPLRSLSP